MQCRRCHSTRLLRLDKKSSEDNDVFRCQECSLLFSPPTPPASSTAALGPGVEVSRTVAVRSGYRGQV